VLISFLRDGVIEFPSPCLVLGGLWLLPLGGRVPERSEWWTGEGLGCRPDRSSWNRA
jgi:hypothetical protein